jgi:cytochrome P450
MSRLLSPNPERGYKVPSKRDLRDEMLTIVAAGEDTTGTSIMVTMYNIIANPEIQARLLAELKEVLPTPESTAPYIQLEKLPYLVRSFPSFNRLTRGSNHPTVRSD